MFSVDDIDGLIVKRLASFFASGGIRRGVISPVNLCAIKGNLLFDQVTSIALPDIHKNRG
ncbi:hypothetical protein [Planktothricoides raciborskii]|uniref:Uncharacterized protein n=1 Tax=Planktothricoides raciborskii GIHE-MW2 TaxID=2792601 RepID=A0AAU8JJU7_9CYAN